MSRINALPKGLQELLGNTSQGKNPSELLGDVRPTFDMLPFWSADRTHNVVATGAVAAFAAGVEVTIPEGEAWIPLAASCDTFATVGQVWALNLHLTDQAGNARSRLAQVDQITAAGTREIGCSIVFPQRFLLGPGWVFRGQVDEFGGGAPTLSVDVTFIKVLI